MGFVVKNVQMQESDNLKKIIKALNNLGVKIKRSEEGRKEYAFVISWEYDVIKYIKSYGHVTTSHDKRTLLVIYKQYEADVLEYLELSSNKDEVWKSIPRYVGKYEVSNKRRVRSIPRVSIIGQRKKVIRGGLLQHTELANGKRFVLLYSGINNQKPEYFYF